MTACQFRSYTLLAVLLVPGCQACSHGKQADVAAAPSETPAAANAAPPTGNLELIQGTPTAGGLVFVAGWAADPADGAPVQKIEITLDDKVIALANPLDIARPDVV